jgi:hypothetical protein
LARWLASDGLLCVPWNNGLESGVAVFPCPSNENAGDETDHNLRRLLTDAATVRISERNSEERMRREVEKPSAAAMSITPGASPMRPAIR